MWDFCGSLLGVKDDLAIYPLLRTRQTKYTCLLLLTQAKVQERYSCLLK